MEPNTGVGARPRRRRNQNQPNQRRAQPQLQEAQVQQVEQENGFGDGSIMLEDLRKITGLIRPDIVEQEKAVCWAVVLSRLLQALYNKDKPVFEHLEFSYEDFVDQFRNVDMEGAVGNIKKAVEYIATYGLPKRSVKGLAREQARRVTWDFNIDNEATEDTIIRILSEKKAPIALIINTSYNLRCLREGILFAPPIDEDSEKHVMLIVGYGRTREGKIFFYVQNSWGEHWGIKGYGRIALMGKCKIIYG